MQPGKRYTENLNKVLHVLPWGNSKDKAASSGISLYLLKTASLDTLVPINQQCWAALMGAQQLELAPSFAKEPEVGVIPLALKPSTYA